MKIIIPRIAKKEKENGSDFFHAICFSYHTTPLKNVIEGNTKFWIDLKLPLSKVKKWEREKWRDQEKREEKEGK